MVFCCILKSLKPTYLHIGGLVLNWTLTKTFSILNKTKALLHYHFPRAKFCFGVNYREILLQCCQSYARITYRFNPINPSIEWICRISKRIERGTIQPSWHDHPLKVAMWHPAQGVAQLLSRGRAPTYPKPTAATLTCSGSQLAGGAGRIKQQKRPNLFSSKYAFLQSNLVNSKMDLNLEEKMCEQKTVKTEDTFHLVTLEVSISVSTATVAETGSENPGA